MRQLQRAGTRTRGFAIYGRDRAFPWRAAYVARGCWPVCDNPYPGYVELLELLPQRDLALRLERDPQALPDLLRQCNGEYLTQGARSLAHLPPNCANFCFRMRSSNMFRSGIAAERLRVLNRNGICAHRIDLKDCLGGGLDNLRFSDPTWEGKLFRSSTLPAPRVKLNTSFRPLTDEDLLVSGFGVVLRGKG